MLGIGLLGTGLHGSRYASHLAKGEVEGMKLVACARRDRMLGEAKARELGCRFHGSIEELVHDRDVQAVLVVTPAGSHSEAVLAAVRAHKPVLVEKPLTHSLEEARALCDEARAILRPRFLAADVGITGANFLIAETGSGIIVTNEGNGDLTQTLPRVQVALAGIEKVVPTLEDAATLLRLLARSATGQEFSSYTTVSGGPRRPGDLDGPEHYHVVLLDNGRTKVLATPFRESLQCIRCGACLNACPVYRRIGGHAYGGVYSGPIGSILTPLYDSVPLNPHLPHASSLCGACQAACPVKINIHEQIYAWRAVMDEKHQTPLAKKEAMMVAGRLLSHPEVYRIAAQSTEIALKALPRFAIYNQLNAWSRHREVPAPADETFHEWYRKHRST